MWEPGAQGKITELEPGQPGVAGCADEALRRRAPTRAPSTTSPRRSSARPSPRAATSPRAKTTTCWCRASSRDANALGYFGYAYYVENKDKLKAVADRQREGPGRSLPSLGGGRERQLPRRWRARSSSTSTPRRSDKPEVKEFVRVLHDARREARQGSEVRPAARRRLRRAAWDHVAVRQDRHGVRRRGRDRYHHRRAAKREVNEALRSTTRVGA